MQKIVENILDILFKENIYLENLKKNKKERVLKLA